LPLARRKASIVFSYIDSRIRPSGDLVPGGAAPYLKAGWVKTWSTLRRNRA